MNNLISRACTKESEIPSKTTNTSEPLLHIRAFYVMTLKKCYIFFNVLPALLASLQSLVASRLLATAPDPGCSPTLPSEFTCPLYL